MFVLELTKSELDSLIKLIKRHNVPCEDCEPYSDCYVFMRGACMVKNLDNVLAKIKELS